MKPRTREPRPAIGLCASPTALWTRLLWEVGFPKNPEGWTVGQLSGCQSYTRHFRTVLMHLVRTPVDDKVLL